MLGSRVPRDRRKRKLRFENYERKKETKMKRMMNVMVAGLLAAGALCLYIDGAAKQAEGDLFYYMYTRERAGAKLLPVLPAMFCAFGMTVAGLILGIRDDNADKPVRDEKLLRDLGSIQDRAVHQVAARSQIYLRVVVITLTEAGRALQEKAKDIPLKAAGCIDLPPEKAQMLYALLYELLDVQKNKTTKGENENENGL